MTRIVAIILLILAGESTKAQTTSAGPSREPTRAKSTHVLVVSGINRHPKERRLKDKAVMELRRFFIDNAGVSPDRLSVLVGSGSLVRQDSKTSTAVNVKETVKSLSAAVKPEDRFIFYYVGQANIVAGKLRLNLPGADITHEQLGEWTNEIKASSMLIVLDCPGAGLAVKSLAGRGRVVIGACTGEQHYSTQFSEHFVPALVDDNSDTDGNGKVSLLEAFTAASRQLDDLFREQGLLKTETPVLEDNEDGIPSQRPWRYKQDNADGQAASAFFLSSK
jgi:hypothetical protein